jgi:hypothetical protein
MLSIGYAICIGWPMSTAESKRGGACVCVCVCVCFRSHLKPKMQFWSVFNTIRSIMSPLNAFREKVFRRFQAKTCLKFSLVKSGVRSHQKALLPCGCDVAMWGDVATFYCAVMCWLSDQLQGRWVLVCVGSWIALRTGVTHRFSWKMFLKTDSAPNKKTSLSSVTTPSTKPTWKNTLLTTQNNLIRTDLTW